MGSTRLGARALRVLEMIGTPPALKVLADLAESKGDDHLSVLVRERIERGRKQSVPALTRPGESAC
jgi:hypothetical protein